MKKTFFTALIAAILGTAFTVTYAAPPAYEPQRGGISNLFSKKNTTVGIEATVLDDLEAYLNDACRVASKEGYEPLNLQQTQLADSLGSSLARGSTSYFHYVWSYLVARYTDRPDCRVALHFLIKNIEGKVEKPKFDNLDEMHQAQFLDTWAHRTVNVYAVATLFRALGGGKPNERLSITGTARNVRNVLDPRNLWSWATGGWTRLKAIITVSDEQFARLAKESEEEWAVIYRAAHSKTPLLPAGLPQVPTTGVNLQLPAGAVGAIENEVQAVAGATLKSLRPTSAAERLRIYFQSRKQIAGTFAKETKDATVEWMTGKQDAYKQWRDAVKKTPGNAYVNTGKAVAKATAPMFKALGRGAANLSLDLAVAGLVTLAETSWETQVLGWNELEAEKPNVQLIFSRYQGWVIWALEENIKALRTELQTLQATFSKRFKVEGAQTLEAEVETLTAATFEAAAQLDQLKAQAPEYESVKKLENDAWHTRDENTPEYVTWSVIPPVLSDCDDLTKRLAQFVAQAKEIEAQKLQEQASQKKPRSSLKPLSPRP